MNEQQLNTVNIVDSSGAYFSIEEHDVVVSKQISEEFSIYDIPFLECVLIKCIRI